MYSGNQSDNAVSSNAVIDSYPSEDEREVYLDTNWNSLMSTEPKIYFPGSNSFLPQSFSAEQKHELQNPVNGAGYSNALAEDKKAKGIAGVGVVQDYVSPYDRIQRSPQLECKRSLDERDEEEELPPVKQSKEASAQGDDPKEDYVHVRAKRGQATNSHSLAERVRRKKISERMKLLQDLVPGCNKITGKAVMLDEIINYVQSLQRQVEFLSMKLATVNPEINAELEHILSKDRFLPQNGYPGFFESEQGASALHHPLSGSTLHGIMQSQILSSFPNSAALLQNPAAQVTNMTQVHGIWQSKPEEGSHLGFMPKNSNDSLNLSGT